MTVGLDLAKINLCGSIFGVVGDVDADLFPLWVNLMATKTRRCKMS
jgi:hypothetical protein